MGPLSSGRLHVSSYKGNTLKETFYTALTKIQNPDNLNPYQESLACKPYSLLISKP